jgi:hypothetical protein
LLKGKLVDVTSLKGVNCRKMKQLAAHSLHMFANYCGEAAVVKAAEGSPATASAAPAGDNCHTTTQQLIMRVCYLAHTDYLCVSVCVWCVVVA